MRKACGTKPGHCLHRRMISLPARQKFPAPAEKILALIAPAFANLRSTRWNCTAN